MRGESPTGDIVRGAAAACRRHPERRGSYLTLNPLPFLAAPARSLRREAFARLASVVQVVEEGSPQDLLRLRFGVGVPGPVIRPHPLNP